jgi:HEAT repeat protein
MRGPTLFLTACLLAVAADSALAQSKSSEKPAPPETIGGKTLRQWIDKIKARDDPSVRETAIRTVPFFGKPGAAAVPSLLDILQNDHDASCRVNACISLYYLADRVSDADLNRTVAVLAHSAADDPQAIVRFHAALAAGALGPKAIAAIPSLMRRIGDQSSWEVRRAVVASLAAIAGDKKNGPDARAVSAIANLLLNTDEPERSGQVRMEAVMALGDMGAPADNKEFTLAVQALKKSLKDHDKPVQIWAQAALMKLNGVTAEQLSALAMNLKVKDSVIKFHTARALLALHDDAKAHVPDIAKLLDDPDPIVVATAIDVLAGFGTHAKTVVPRLEQLRTQKDQTDYFRQAARAAIKEITGVEPAANDTGPAASGTSSKYVGPPDEIGGKTLKQWLEDIKSRDPSIRETAIRAVPYFGKPSKAAAGPLVTLLKRNDTDAACRCHACLALSALAASDRVDEAEDAVRALSGRVDLDPQAIVRYYAVVALGSFGSKAHSAIPSLVNRIRDSHSWELRKAVVSVLGAVAVNDRVGPDPRAVTAIANLLLSGSERSGEVRMEAVMALGGMGRPADQRELALSIHALQNSARNDSDKAVRIWARVALMAVDKVTKEGLDEVAGNLTKGKDVMAKVQAIRALGAMGKEAKSKIPDIIKALDDKDPMVQANAIQVLGDLGPLAQDALPKLQEIKDKKDQNDYFKQMAKTAIEQINKPKK